MSIIQPLEILDLPNVLIIEQQAHAFPWNRSIFETNFGARYLNLKLSKAGSAEIIGYAITQVILDEATLFNIAIAPNFQRQGYAKKLLSDLQTQLKEKSVATLWLEVRASNTQAIRLYESLGFNEVTIRSNYYPTHNGREDAIIMASYL